jgi:hypothetical protein
MGRTLRPTLREMLERANPHVKTVVELSARDQGTVLRRAADQLLTLVADGGNLVSTSPAASAVEAPSGGITLASAPVEVVSQYTDAGYFNIPQEDGGPTYLHTVGWQIDGFVGGVLSSVTAKMKFGHPALFGFVSVKLQIYRATQIAGTLVRAAGSSTVTSELTQTSFTPLLKEPVVIGPEQWAPLRDGAGFADIVFDLSRYRLRVDPTSGPPPAPGESGALPELFFSITTDQRNPGNLVEWRYDTTSAQTIPGVGFVREVSWERTNPNDPSSVWVKNESGRAMTFKLAIEEYTATSENVYLVELPDLPGVESVGRVVFGRSEPVDTAATLELSTAGLGGPWTPVVQGDIVTPAQLAYHLRLTMEASADLLRAPLVSELGIDFRNRVDVTAESIVEPMSQEVSVPFLTPSIGEGRVTVVRTGRRDYRDVGSEIASSGPDTMIDADVWLASEHQRVTRDDWFHMARAVVSGRQPTAVTEAIALLSFAKTLKRKIPARAEVINRVHTVVSATTTQVAVSPALQGATLSGDEYDGAGYYLRVRKSAVAGLEPGMLFTISGNSGIDQLDFTPNADPALTQELPAAFAALDEIEVHSATFTQPALVWVDADPADVWYEVLTQHLGVPDDRIGLSDVGTSGRGGFPPTVEDRAPGDPGTQDKCRVTLKITEAVTGDTLIDQLSFIMGGTTIEVAGQIVFRQIYQLRDAAGIVTVSPDATSRVFDPRDFTGLDTPTGREQRISEIACDYGVDTSAGTQLPASTVVYGDADALAQLETQDVEGLGTSTIPDDIARWCYNSADGGRFLAQQLCAQVVFATSTGVRVWPFTLVNACPELMVGDSIVLVTDQYTDWDPGRNVAVRGWNAYPLTIVSATADGRRFRGFLQGLAGVSGLALRGGLGSLQDYNAPSLDITPTPGPTSWSLDWGGTGTITLEVDGGPPGAPGADPLTVVLDADPHAYTFRATGAGLPATQTIHIPALAGASAAPSFTSLGIAAYDYALDEVEFDWTVADEPVGATYNLTIFEQTALVNTNVGDTTHLVGVTAPYVFTCVNDIDAAGPRDKTFRMTVEMVSGSTVVATSATVSQIIPSNT